MKRKIYNIEQDLSNGNLQFESLFYDFHQHICKYTKKNENKFSVMKKNEWKETNTILSKIWVTNSNLQFESFFMIFLNT